MALKDFHKTLQENNGIMFQRFIPKPRIRIEIYLSSEKLWNVDIENFNVLQTDRKSFKSKSQALKFAKQYMRKH
jgi:hypothetical protein